MEERCVFTAKLYPVLYPDSIPELADLLWMADCKSLQDKVSHREKWVFISTSFLFGWCVALSVDGLYHIFLLFHNQLI